MHALDVEGELLEIAQDDRPTIPVPAPRESGVRLNVRRVSAASVAATVDVVVCDLSRDPRSEDFVSDPEPVRVTGPLPSIVRALKR